MGTTYRLRMLSSDLDDELISLIEEEDYTLILDEVMNVVEREIGKADIYALMTSGLIKSRKTRTVSSG